MLLRSSPFFGSASTFAIIGTRAAGGYQFAGGPISRSWLCTAARRPLPSRSKAAELAAAEQKDGSWFFMRWARWFAKFRKTRLALRGARILFGAYLIYNLGQVQGMAEYARDPRYYNKLHVKQLLEAFDDPEHRYSEKVGGPTMGKDTAEHQRVQQIGKRVMQAAKQVAEQNLEKQFKAIYRQAEKEFEVDPSLAGRQTLDKYATRQAKEAMRDESSDLFFWSRALRELKRTHYFVVLNHGVPNAFVHSLTPAHIYVHAGLLSTSKNRAEHGVDQEGLDLSDDEVAMVLAHEFSHTILGHGVQGLQERATVEALKILVFAMLDPTGVVSLLVEAFVGSTLNKTLVLPFSRQHETEADTLGLEIMANACYDVKKASGFFEKWVSRDGTCRGD